MINYRQVRDDVVWLAMGLDPDTSGRFICPACKGGSHREVSLLVTRIQSRKVQYKCFRASCEFAGTSYFKPSLVGNQIPMHGVTYTHREREFREPTRALTDVERDFITDKFGLRFGNYWIVDDIRIYEDGSRYVLPVMGSYDVIGYIGYSFTKSPKALTFKEKQIEPFVGRFWPINPKYTWVTVIVEDWWSAAKVAQAGVRALCLNGVHLSWETAVGLGVERRDVVLALDSGTLPLMLKYKRMYGGLWQSCTIWELDKDLKYEQEETIINALRTGKTSFVSRDSESGVI